ncbi:MAG: amidohydrolase family protein [Coriobacteriales bacterium]|nr:amidohydrolase family protein [Coriobacteriales bacterium]
MSNETKADLVVYGKIYTAEKENDGLCDAFAVKDGKFIYVGDKAGAAAFIDECKTKVIDNTDKGLIIPGCTEGHGHFIGIDALVRMMPAYFESDYKKVLDVISEKLKEDPNMKFFMSWGFDYQTFVQNIDKDKCYAEEIEAVAPGIPVVMFDASGHQALCNTTALKKAGIADGQKVRGGNIYLTNSGVPNGLLSDEVVCFVVGNAIDLSSLGPETFETACKSAIATLNQRGFTNYYDCYINFIGDVDFYPCIKEMDENGTLNCNVTSTYTIRSYESDKTQEKTDYLIEQGEKYKSEHFNPLHLKLFADGVVEARTGWLLDEYPGAEPGQEHGNMVWKPEELKKIVAYANSKGIPVHTHTFGDAACKAVIDAYIYGEEFSDKHIHNSLAHVRNITDEDIERCGAHNIGIAENLIWHAMDMPEEQWKETLELANATFPAGIFENGYPMKSLIDKGIIVTSSTDAPCAEALEGNILNIIEVSVTGQSPEEEGIPYNTKELLSIREVLECLTINGARQLEIDDKCGSIKQGKNADFVILDKDFLDYQGEELRTIHNTKIKSVYFEGNEVYSG